MLIASCAPTGSVPRSGRVAGVIAQNAIQLIALFVLPLALLWSLKHTISTRFAYEGYGFYADQAPITVVALFALMVLPGAILTVCKVNPGIVVLWMLYLVIYVPAQFAPVYASGMDASAYMRFNVVLFLGFLLATLFASTSLDSIPTLALSPKVYWGGLTAFSLIVYALLAVQIGPPRGIPGLADVYSTRAAFSEVSVGLFPGFAYLFGWQFKVVNPMLMTIGGVRRRPLPIIAGFAGQLLIYSYTGHKSVLFSAFLVFGFYAATILRGKLVGFLFPVGASLLVLGAIAFDTVFGSVWGSSLFIRRLFIVPGTLTGYYWEFFSAHPFTQALGPISGVFREYPYDLSVPNTIGEVYFRNPETAANANLWADGFASFGYPGVIAFSLLLGVILLFFNSTVSRVGWRFATVLAGTVCFSWVNSAFLTSLLTHGIAFGLVLLILYPRESVESSTKTGKPVH